jgi:hypothetical protein
MLHWGKIIKPHLEMSSLSGPHFSFWKKPSIPSFFHHWLQQIFREHLLCTRLCVEGTVTEWTQAAVIAVLMIIIKWTGIDSKQDKQVDMKSQIMRSLTEKNRPLWDWKMEEWIHLLLLLWGSANVLRLLRNSDGRKRRGEVLFYFWVKQGWWYRRNLVHALNDVILLWPFQDCLGKN